MNFSNFNSRLAVVNLTIQIFYDNIYNFYYRLAVVIDDKAIDEHMTKLAKVGRLNVDAGALRWTPLLTTRPIEEDDDDSDPNRTPDLSATPTPSDRRSAQRGGRKKKNPTDALQGPVDEETVKVKEVATSGKKVTKGAIVSELSGSSEVGVTPAAKRGPGRPPKLAKGTAKTSAGDKRRRTLSSRQGVEEPPVSIKSCSLSNLGI